MPRVASSAIATIAYDAVAEELHVTFHETGRYVYSRVPRGVYDAFMRAESKGAFFHEHIRDRYRHRHIEDDQ